jgi:CheY-like chemotaxis protein
MLRDLYQVRLPEDVFETRFAEHGETALDLYRSWQPDILILDIRMPVMTGFTVLKEIRKQIGDHTTTIIMATALNDKRDIKDCINLGIQGYIIKPFKHTEVGDKILAYYQAHQSQIKATDPLLQPHTSPAPRDPRSHGGDC